MNIAFVGNYERYKGSHIFEQVVTQLGHQHCWFIFGVVKDPVRQLDGIRTYGVIHKQFPWGGLPRMLRRNKVDVALLLSMLPESFSMTFFETISAEIPVIASDKGFPAFLLPQYPYFVDVEKGSAPVINAIDQLSNSQERSRVRKIVTEIKQERLPEMQQKIQLKYNRIEELLSRKD
ncbi:MAG: glycosyltransferase [Candidatus Dojkabacteria bacterium]|nr:glycosyltransferase [Candidatus Dojkabacteria bacterium]